MLPIDAARDDCVEAAAKKVMRLEGRIDVLVVNAGFGVALAGAEESSIEQPRFRAPHATPTGWYSKTPPARRDGVTTSPSENEYNRFAAQDFIRWH